MNLLGVQMNNYFIITTSGSLKRLLSNSPTYIYWLFCDKTIDKSRNIDMQSILKKSSINIQFYLENMKTGDVMDYYN